MTCECIGCGCTDDEACDGGCSWALLNDEAGMGICTNCIEAFDDPQARLAEAAAGAAPRWEDDSEEDVDAGGLILPGDPEYYSTLRGGR